MAYLRLVVSDYDDLAFERIINVPKRGLGTKSLLDIQTNARKKYYSFRKLQNIIKRQLF